MLPRVMALTSPELSLAILRKPAMVSPHTTLRAAIAQMSGEGDPSNSLDPEAKDSRDELERTSPSSCVLVVEAERAIGILTEQDILRLTARQQSLDDAIVTQVMAHPVITLRESAFTDLACAIDLLEQHNIRHLPIVDDRDRPIGLVTPESLWQISQESCYLVETLAAKVAHLEAEKITLLESRTAELEKQVEARTTSLNAKVEREKLVVELAAKIQSSLNLPLILETTVEQIRQVLDCDRFLIYQFQPDWSGVVIAESVRGDWLSALGNQINDSCFQQQAATLYSNETPITVNDINSAGYSDCHIQLLERYRVKANLVSPLRVAGKLWGLLIGHQCTSARQWHPEDVVLLQEISLHLAIALQQATTHQQLQAELQERQQAEQTLKKAEERYSLATRAARVGVWERNLRTDEFYLDANLKALLGYADGEIANDLEEWVKFVHPDDREAVMAAARDCIEGKTPEYVCEHRMIHKNGSIVWILVRGRVLHDAEGNPERFLGTDTDISDRKQAEIRWQESEERYASLTAAAPVGIFHTDAIGRCTYVNDCYCQIAGLTPETAAGEGWQQGLHPDDRQRIILEWECAVREKRPFQLEYRFQHADDEVRWVYGQAVVERDADGEIVGYVGIITDISDRKQADAQIQEMTQRLALATNSANIGVWDFDVVANRLIWDKRMYELYGIDPTESSAVYETWQKGVHPDDMPMAHAAVQAAITGERDFHTEFRVVWPDGQVRFIEAHAIALRDEQGIAQRLIGVNWDISDRKQAEAERLQAKKVRLELKLLEQLFDIILAGYWDWDIVNHQAYLSPSFKRMFGYEDNELPNTLESWQNSIFPEDLPSVLDCFDRHIRSRGQIPFYNEVRYRHQDGSTVWAICSGQVIEWDEDSNPLRMIGFNMDISDRKWAEEHLRQLSTRLNLAVESAAIGIWDWDISTDRLIWDRRMCDLYGIAPEDFAGVYGAWLACVHPDDRQSAETTVRQAMQNGTDFDSEFRIIHPDSSIHFIQANALVQYDDRGEPYRMIGINYDISDLKQAESERQQLIQELSTFKLALDRSAIVAITDARGIIVYVNDYFCNISGYSKDELIGQTHRLVNSGYHPPSFFQEMWDTIARGKIWRGQICNRTKDGRSYWLDSTLVPFLNENGQPFQYLAIRFDITDRQAAEQIILQQAGREKLLREITQKIRQSLDLQTIFDTACREIRSVLQADRVGIFKFDPSADFSEGEFVAESVVTGFDSIVGIPVRDRCFGEHYAILYTRGRVLIADDIYQNNLSPCHADILTRFKVRACLVMPLLCGQELWGLLCVHQCASDRHWQQPEVDLTHQLATQIAIAIQQANLYEQLQQELNERQHAQQLLTERNQQLAISNEELARATRLKDEFLANMSHELRTPLNAISGMTEGLQEGIFGEVNPQQIKALQTIKQSGAYLLELINDILDLAKIESGQIELEIAPTSVASLCRSSVAFIKQQALKKRIQVEIELLPDLPDLLVDERRIRQVLINLLANAVKFTPKGGRVTLKVSHEWCAPPDLAGVTWMQSYRATLKEKSMRKNGGESQKYLRIATIDTGIGIAPKNMDKLFQPFVQIDSTLNRQYAGTGLGLALVKRIIELHRGEVGLSSAVGVGSCFEIGLPCVAARDSSSHSEIPSFSSIELDRPSGGISPLILLAEDNEANIVTISSYLKAKGYRLLVAKNGIEAIALARDERPNLILMDIQMPKMDGLEAIQQIRRAPDAVNIPIIALTALAMPGDRDRCLAAGANDYLSKPIRLQQLVATIQHHLAPREDR